ncbi:Peroxisome chaperone and import receptor [Myotisia sp. PD_48]|nr:Peroxisome chaperone and import receptor [Myotisia sp. PD_48]
MDQTITPIQIQREDDSPQPMNEAVIQNQPPIEEDEEGSDFDDLDDVLDDFSTTKKSSHPPKTADEHGKDVSTPREEAKAGEQKGSDFGIDEEALLKQLEAGMAELMASGGNGDAEIPQTSALPQAPGVEDWDALAAELSKSGLQPDDLMKLMMGEDFSLPTGSEGDKDIPLTTDSAATTTSTGATASTSAKKTEENFQETIRKTMERMQESGDKATHQATESGNDDMLMQVLKAMEAGGLAGAGDGDDGNLDSLFMGIMEQLSNKEMLYEPLKELNDKFGPWLKENKDKVSKEDFERYELQSVIVAEIIEKFDEKGYTDDNPTHRAYIWERMQKMQAAGSPPDDLVSNPLPDESKMQEALGGMGEGCPQQ